jgi:hypothetical protein
MPWSNARPRRSKYDAAHNTLRARHIAALRAAGTGMCAEPVCTAPTRVITPDMDLHLSHDPTGRTVIGLSHRECNIREAARRARARQTTNRLGW